MKQLLILLLALFADSLYAKEQVYMTSLNWPPYSGEDLAENGVSIAIARAVFSELGYELIVEFKPWVRTVRTAKKKERYIGYFPEYEFETDALVFSNSIGTSPLGFVEQISKPIEWSVLQDLDLYRIGVVQGYINTEQFDSYVAQGKLNVEATTDDLKNIIKVAKGRLDLAVIDANVFRYLINTDARREVLQKKIAMNKNILEEKDIVVAFRNTEEGRKWRNLFNLGLAQIDVAEVFERLSHSTHQHQTLDLMTIEPNAN
jgi:polar amino acid transport system substrate-binding protein